MSNNKRKSQAGKAVDSAKGKKTNNSQNGKQTGKKDNENNSIPIRVVSSIAIILLFIVFLIALILPEGFLVAALNSLLHGLLGRAAYILLVLALLYMFVIHAFSPGKPITMRTICLLCFVLSCGCIAQLTFPPVQYRDVPSAISELYMGGIGGTSAGLLCGGLGLLISMLCGKPISYILLILSAILTLLASMQITIPSIVRAFQNCPKMEEDPDKPEPQEPASIVVNHIANKRIEYLKRRKERENEPDVPSQEPTESSEVSTPTPIPKANRNIERANDIMSQIEGDVSEPVAAAGESKSVPPKPESIAAEMPPFEPAAIPHEEPVPVKINQPSAPTISEPISVAPTPMPVPEEIKKEKVTAKDAEESAAAVAAEIAQTEALERAEYCYPPIDLLKQNKGAFVDGTEELRENTARLNETLSSFKIEAHIVNVTRGPSVTRYEVELEKGVRLNKLTSAADDIALSLGATGVRIAAIPGKISVVGIEVPNRAVTTVSLREVIDSHEFASAKSKSSFAVGKDIGGNCIIGNISKLPHMLIAGTTGSGKSVCMNSIIISLLYKASPEDVKLIMVDPKMVELGIYNGIPHLLIPVVTDPKKAAGSLQWAVAEMLRRYRAMSDAGVRDLESYNSIVETQEVDGPKLPQVVVIIDELADLMLVAAKEVEESICRIAQMGRAAGIHLIIATQRPSADVITGLMKANIPSRIAFAVASAMESRIILDTPGAEKLVGKGDMLFAPIGCGKPKRVQGCFVSDAEVEAAASYVKANFTNEYDQEIIAEIDKKAAQTGTKATASEPEANPEELDCDEMLPAAVDVILETGQASVSLLQRRLKLGYSRAARIVDEMEEKGIVGPFVGSKPRTILITKEQWDTMKNGGNSQMEFEDIEEENTEIPEEI